MARVPTGLILFQVLAVRVKDLPRLAEDMGLRRSLRLVLPGLLRVQVARVQMLA